MIKARNGATWMLDDGREIRRIDPHRRRMAMGSRPSSSAWYRPRHIEEDYDTSDRPRTRADCVDGPRPCPWVSCRYHLAVDDRGRPCQRHSEVWELRETCALDVAAQGRHTLGEVGAVLGVSKERVRQIEEEALWKLRVMMEL
jgi:hypothetical protein